MIDIQKYNTLVAREKLTVQDRTATRGQYRPGETEDNFKKKCVHIIVTIKL